MVLLITVLGTTAANLDLEVSFLAIAGEEDMGGNHFQVVYNGQPVIEIDDHTFMTGLVGLWTKSDEVTYFDDLQLRILK